MKTMTVQATAQHLVHPLAWLEGIFNRVSAGHAGSTLTPEVEAGREDARGGIHFFQDEDEMEDYVQSFRQ